MAIALAVFGGPLVLAAIPILVAGGVLVSVQVYQRRQTAQDISKFRDEADSDKTDFTARDRETQV